MVIWITLPVAIVLGFLAGLGVGGGSLLMLWLTFVVGMEYGQARIMNLLFFLPSALIATLFHRKQGSVDIKKTLPAVVAGCALAALFSHVGLQYHFQIIFGNIRIKDIGFQNSRFSSLLSVQN